MGFVGALVPRGGDDLTPAEPRYGYRLVWRALGWAMVIATPAVSLIPAPIDLSEGRDEPKLCLMASHSAVRSSIFLRNCERLAP